MKLKYKFPLLIALIFIAFTAIARAYSQYIISHINESWGLRFAEKQVQFDKQRTLLPLLHEIALAQKMALEPALIEMALHEEDPIVNKKALEVLERYRLKFQDRSYFFALLKSGHYYFNDAEDKFKGRQLRYTLSKDNPNDRWFYSSIEAQRDYLVNVDPDEHLGTTKVWINVALKHEGRIVGLIGTGLDITQFIEESVNVEQEGIHNLFVDGELAIQLHNDPKLIDYASITKKADQRNKVDILLSNPADVERLRTTLRQLENSPDKIATLWVDFKDEKQLLGVAYLREIGWFDLTLMNDQALSLQRNLNILPVLVLMLFAAFFSVGLMLHRLILRPIQQMSESVLRVQHKDYATEPPIVGTGEIALLSSQFRAMVRMIRDTNQALESKVLQRTEQLSQELTERKRVEDALRKLTTAVEQSPSSIVITNIEANIEYVNEAFIKVTGFDREEVIGKNPRILRSSKTPKTTFDDMWSTLLQGKVWKGELINKRKDGREYTELALISPVRRPDGTITHYLAIKEDITERKQIDEKLHFNEQMLRGLYELSPLGIALVDMEGHYINFNESFQKITGYTRQELLGLDYWKLTPKAYEAMEAEQLKSLIETGRYGPYEKEYIHKDGRLIPLRLNGMIVKGDDGKDYIWSIVEDIADRKRSEQAMHQAKEIAESMAKSKSEFLANMSHEIRTPMNAIIGLSHLALNQPVSSEIRDYLEKINASSESLLGILNDILDFSKVESGKLVIDHIPFDLDHIKDTLYNLFSTSAKQKQINFQIDIAEDIPKRLIGDPLRIQQVLSNLIGNAIKFTEQGEVRTQIKCLKCDERQALIRFIVSDTGIGIKDLSILFQPFSQADNSAIRRFGGTGLGLAISHGLLQLMNSEFHVESEVGKGAQFRFDIDLSIAAAESSPEINRRNEHLKQGMLGETLRQQGLSLHGRRILVAEDNTVNQIVVIEFLKLSGIDADIAQNGIEAINMVRHHDYDAILMDVHMPEMGGVEATELIRKQPEHAKLPIIALTAGVTEEERANCLACGMNDFVAKPIQPEKLIETLKRWIKKD